MILSYLVSPPVRLHTLVTAFQFGHWAAALAFAFQIVAAGLYLWGVRRLARRGRPWPAIRTLAFMAGLFVLFVALVSGVASYDSEVFTVHVVQHLLIMMLAPPLLSLAAPVTLALQAGPRTLQTRLLRVLRSGPVEILSRPVLAASLYYVSMWIDMQTSFYPYSLEHPLVHNASHLAMFVFGCLFWWPVLGVDELPHRLGHPARFMLLAVGMPFESFLAIALMSTRSTIAPEHSLSDTHLGGSVFWVGAMTVTAVAVLVCGLQWMRSDERDAVRADRRPARQAGGITSVGMSSGSTDGWWEAVWLARTGRVPGVAEMPPSPGPDSTA